MPGLLPHIRYVDGLHIGTKSRLTPEHFLFLKKRPRSLYPERGAAVQLLPTQRYNDANSTLLWRSVIG